MTTSEKGTRMNNDEIREYLNGQNKFPILAITGYSKSGKSLVASYLQEIYGFSKHSFAAPGKQFLADHFDFAEQKKEDVPEFFPEFPTYRTMLKTLLSTWGRHITHQDIWPLVLIRKLRSKENNPVVIDDLRFDNEMNILVDHFPNRVIFIRVDRKGTEPRPVFTRNPFKKIWNRLFWQPHESERGVASYMIDFVLENDGEITSIFQAVDDMLNTMIQEHRRTEIWNTGSY